MESLSDTLDTMTNAGELVERLPDQAVRCLACGHRCLIREGRRGICQVRFNQDGELRVPWGYVAALQCDPTEKKPFYHFLPGSDTLTFGMLGCDFHCGYCQNWVSSQALRDPACDVAGRHLRQLEPRDIIQRGLRAGAKVVGSSYNEPLITSEWARAIFAEGQAAGLKCVYISNGNATPEVLDYLEPNLSGYKIDLKTMQDRQYRQLGGVLQHVLDTIRSVYARGIWIEVVTLIVPGFNDSTDELMDAARFIQSVSPDIPWHVTAFHKDYRMTRPENTTAEMLVRAAEIGQEAGLRYVYAGNAPGQVGEYEDTRCHQCGMTLIRRYGYMIQEYALTDTGNCPQCHSGIPGVWPEIVEEVRLDSSFNLSSRRPRLV
ncbi:MAG: AmmeMemoRadiSam system radical SAM enzyme [Anaerolineales bacterium]|nr:MAG: AmmeMemoRadiSam system radical SAM enzyme [Anaerolineales bacterium]